MSSISPPEDDVRVARKNALRPGEWDAMPEATELKATTLIDVQPIPEDDMPQYVRTLTLHPDEWDAMSAAVDESAVDESTVNVSTDDVSVDDYCRSLRHIECGDGCDPPHMVRGFDNNLRLRSVYLVDESDEAVLIRSTEALHVEFILNHAVNQPQPPLTDAHRADIAAGLALHEAYLARMKLKRSTTVEV